MSGYTHVHDEYPSLVELLHHILRRHSDSAHKQLGLLFDNHVNQIVQLALGVIVVCLPSGRRERRDEQVDTEGCVMSGAT